MNYRLFISDFDGTLVRAAGTVSQKNIDAIAAYRKAGGIFVICTGRMLASIRMRLKELGLDEGYVIAFQGAQIADIRTGRLLRDHAFEGDDAVEILRFMEGMGLHIHAYAGDDFFANRRDPLLDSYERICGVKACVSEQPLSDMVASKHMRVVKLLTMQAQEEQEGVQRALEEKFGDRFFVTKSSAWIVEIMPKGQNKASAIGFLADAYHIPREEIAAIGDQENDKPMLEAVGGRFAVANAVDSLKKISTVVPSVEEDGVAYAIRNYAMKGRGEI